jgi:hypothetical protein
MSLDVSLYRTYHISYDKGKTLEEKEECMYESNITHNLGNMASEAGLYEALWRPHRLKEGYNIPEDDHDAEYEFEEANPTFAYQIIDVVEKGLEELKSNPEHYETFNSPNGWGMYKNFVPFVEKYLDALKQYSECRVIVSR